MAKPDKSAFDAAKANRDAAHDAFVLRIHDAEAQVAAGTLTEAGAALIVDAAHQAFQAATDAFVAAVKASHKPARPSRARKPKPAKGGDAAEPAEPAEPATMPATPVGG